MNSTATFLRLRPTALVCLVAACLLLAGALPALADKRPMTPEDLYRIRSVSDPQVSPDGRWVAVTVRIPNLQKNSSDSDIWLLPLAGGPARQLTRGPGADHAARWSPDGKQIAFLSDRDETANLFLIDIGGGEARQLTHAETALHQPLWSADGKSLLCWSRVLPEKKQPLENWTTEELPECEARTVDRLLFRQWDRWLGDERNHLFRVNVEDGSMLELTPGDFDTPPVSLASSREFDLAPDGRELCFVRNADPDSATSTDHNLHTLGTEPGEGDRITDNPALDRKPRYSPDGRWLAYTAMEHAGYEADRERLVLLDRQSGARRVLTEGLDRSVGDPVWAPTSDRIYLTAREWGRSVIYVANLDGVVEKLVDEGYNVGLTLSPDGRQLVFVRSFNHMPGELFVHSLADGTTRQLSSFNAELLAEIDLPQLEEFRFEGAGGAEVHGYLLRPPGFDPLRRYPAVLTIHGGPQNMWADRFMTTWFTFQLVASPGYVGVFINPRGSSGYGSEFREQVSLDYGGRCHEDLMRGMDHVVARYDFVDADRLAAIGGSFGGYSVNWILGHTDRFRCTVSHAGLYNLTNFYGATEELWFPAWDMGETPWDEPELYASRSPHTFAGEFKTPTLVTHGELDYRVPFAESLQLFTALQRQGIDSRLVVFPDEGHVISSPQNNVRWWREIWLWLDRYLGPERAAESEATAN